MSITATRPAAQRPVARRLLRAATALTTPLLPDDYLTYINPLWSTREPRGRVDAVLPETADSATIWLKVGPDWPLHTPGQYVRVGVDIDGVRHWRTYSLTSVPGRDDHRVAITVKATPDGFVSKHLVHHTRPGTIVRLGPPAGEFVLPEARPERVLLLTAGSGITPAMGMLRALIAAGHGLDGVTHVHLAPNRGDVIFGDELRRLAAQHPGFTLHEHHDDEHGVFSPARLQQLLPEWAAHETWACGPAGLLDAVTEAFEAAGVPERLNVERFKPVVVNVTGTGGTVTFTRQQRTATADASTPILVAGEDAGALLPSGCRMGICNSCVGRLCSGAVRDLRTGELLDTPDLMVRTCTTAAAGDVEIDL
ncbi:ferredoxin reductase [Paraconexibacter antarcticus]|uniref:Ferredoxin reductase n=1 Tax=Paraconexibacter antarcticus TaxID=2949664 RepID=A0ABY5DT15_9ACTN|nr:ferredoxin reductase [Paraconexibacter antarcticus]UTI64064.1 ferredoxin reductase [Paraconexibacter antarcticus]